MEKKRYESRIRRCENNKKREYGEKYEKSYK
jgi:hypothetical protein